MEVVEIVVPVKKRINQTPASPISTARLVMETYAQIKDFDWSLVIAESPGFMWPLRLWPMEKHYHWLGRSGGYGVGYGAPASIGVLGSENSPHAWLAADALHDL